MNIILKSIILFICLNSFLASAENLDKDIQYRVRVTDVNPGIKRALDVRLEKKLTEEQLKVLALKLKGDTNFKRTFISYFLPGMKEGSGAWATTHFDPDIEVRILGMTLEQEQKLSEPAIKSGTIIGEWNDERPGVAGHLVIFTNKSKIYYKISFKDGSIVEEELRLIGKKYNVVDSEEGDFYQLRKDGSLDVGNVRGIYANFQSSTKKMEK